jgi:Ser/Thr protein kinase RdoA (MazF antagonist)
MHALAQDYPPPGQASLRPAWHQNDLLVNAEHYLAEQPAALQRLQTLTAELRQLPQTPDSFGLAHTDFTDVNFFVHDQQIYAYDFDDCEHHWFVYDIAVILFDSLPWLPHHEMDEQTFAVHFWEHFMGGYTQENTLDQSWLDRLPLFMKLRQLCLYTFFHKKWDFSDLQEWQQKMVQEFKTNIENDLPCLEIDFNL